MSNGRREWHSTSTPRRNSPSSYYQRRGHSEDPHWSVVLRSNSECAKNDDEHWDDEDSRPRGRPQSTWWQTEEARVPPQIGRGSGVGKAEPSRPAGPPAARPCHNPITPQGPFRPRDDSDGSWIHVSKKERTQRKSPRRDAEGWYHDGHGESSLKKAKSDDRKQTQTIKKRKAANQSSQVGREWRNQREAEGRTSPQVQRE